MVPNAREKPDAEVFTRAGQQLLLHPSALGPTSSLQPPVSTSTKRKWSKYMYGRRPYCGEKQTTIRRYCKKKRQRMSSTCFSIHRKKMVRRMCTAFSAVKNKPQYTGTARDKECLLPVSTSTNRNDRSKCTAFTVVKNKPQYTGTAREETKKIYDLFQHPQKENGPSKCTAFTA